VAGVWPPDESYAIGLLELRATVRALQYLPFDWTNSNIHFRIDNQVALSYVNRLGGRDKTLNDEAQVLWGLLESANAFAHATYIPSRDNPADSLSRIMTRKQASLLDTEWQLNADVFKEVCREFRVNPSVDWFASGENSQLSRFVSFEYDPLAWKTDAFLQSWSGHPGYFFPPFCVISRVLQKIRIDKPKASILIHPRWPSQPWWPDLIQARTRFVQLPPSSVCLRLPHHPALRHRLKKLVLQASIIFFQQS
jgi:hypothetical protein